MISAFLLGWISASIFIAFAADRAATKGGEPK
jgi:hypothetical protein